MNITVGTENNDWFKFSPNLQIISLRYWQFQRWENMEPFSIKIIMFMIVKAMGRCIIYLDVSKYFTYLASENSSVIAGKEGFRQVTETEAQSARS